MIIRLTETKNLDVAMQIMETTLITLIRARKAFSVDLLFLIWEYKKQFKDESALKDFWGTIKEEIRKMIDIVTVSKNKVNWNYFQTYFMSSSVS